MVYLMNVFAKIFAQIFDSSISSDYVVRHVFMDLLVLADREGVVDMTPDAIARRTNVPENVVLHALSELSKVDKKSRSDLEEGRRIVPLDSHRDWGWQIVNFEHYRQIRDEESRRAYFRDKKREYRMKSTSVHKKRKSPQVSTGVLDSPTLSTQGEGELEGEGEGKSSVAVIRLPAIGGEFFQVTQKQLDFWSGLYLGVNVMQELRNMVGWLDASPKRRKTISGMSRFVNSWLSREQDKPSPSKAKPAVAPYPANFFDDEVPNERR